MCTLPSNVMIQKSMCCFMPISLLKIAHVPCFKIWRIHRSCFNIQTCPCSTQWHKQVSGGFIMNKVIELFIFTLQSTLYKVGVPILVCDLFKTPSIKGTLDMKHMLHGLPKNLKSSHDPYGHSVRILWSTPWHSYYKAWSEKTLPIWHEHLLHHDPNYMFQVQSTIVIYWTSHMYMGSCPSDHLC